ncbi:urease accessory protein UreF [Limibaculum sp. M0105]|uniref:Urease accessory protein UreF n=1 Tax=Thermohalobaculum xanthum TaxID=2753746 RepID=A0A8J7M6Z2_9RHOB|nr:urease accessory protein UreF [Thermohalobaculum xanthum]MBK0398679.1 urease accessory protein UreF [Thermohalobaculum xanthum]
MTEALLKLATWLSPSYPVGAFTYSHGFEAAIGDGAIHDAETLAAWIADTLEHGAGRTDAILLAHAWRDPVDEQVAELARALAPSSERLLEAEAQGNAFAATTAAAWGPDLPAAPYPVAIGRAAAQHGLPLEDTAALYLHAFASNLVSAGIRLIPLGQTEGQGVVARLAPLIRRIAAEAIGASLDDIGSACFIGDIAAMRHETQSVRLFRS